MTLVEKTLFKVSAVLPARVRKFLLALAEIGNDRNEGLRLALVPDRRSLFVDVGANRGQFARFMASFYDRVIVFEPIEAFGDELRDVLAPNCTVHGFALADYAGSAAFYVPHDEDPLTVQTASLLQPRTPATHETVMVEVRRLDDFALNDVSFIKIDVEGAEYDVLSGAVATIVRCRPTLLIEIEDRHTNGNTKRVFDLLFGLGYRAVIQRESRKHRGSGLLFDVLRGAAYAGRLKRPELVPVGHLLDRIYEGSHDLNTSFGRRYVNNFLFVPSKLNGKSAR